MSGAVIQFPLRLGLAEDANPKSAPVSSLKTGTNIRWAKDGVIGKSYAFSEVTVPPSDGIRFVTRGDELSVTDGSRLYTQLPDGTWRDADAVCEASLSWETLLDEESGVRSSDVAVYNDMLVHAWVTGDPTDLPESTPVTGSGRLFVQVVDRNTNQPLMLPALVAGVIGGSVVHVRVLIASTYAFVIYSEKDGEIRYVAVDLAALTVSSSAALTAELRTATYFGRFDAMFLAEGSLILFYENTTPVTVTAKFTRSGATLTLAAQLGHLPVQVVAVAIAEDTSTSRIGVVHCIESGGVYSVRFLTVSTALVEIVAPMTIQADFFASQVDIYVHSGGTFGVAYSGTDQSNVDNIKMPALMTKRITVAAGADVSGSKERSMAIGLLSRSFVVDGNRYVFAHDALYGADQGTMYGSGASATRTPSISSYMIGITTSHDESAAPPHRYVGKVDHDIAAPFMIGVLPRAAVTSDATSAYGLLPFQATASPVSFNLRAGIRVVHVTADPDSVADPFRSVSINQEAYISGARLSAWDGRSIFDHAMRAPFFIGPDPDEGGDMASGNYIYQFGAHYRSRAGILHRGPLSPTATSPVTGEGVGSANLFLLPNSIDGKQAPIAGAAADFGESGPFMSAYDIYRSTVGGSILYQLSYPPRYNIRLNDPDELYLTFLDNKADADVTSDGYAVTLDSRPQPYTATGELEDVQPPASSTMCFHLGRLVLITGGGEIWFSKDIGENPNIAPGFNPGFVRLFEQRPTAVCSFVDRLIIFFERGAKFIVGDGPTVADTDDRFSTPQSIQGQIGTTNPRSVVVSPVGVFFQSTDGEIHLLDSGLAMQWIGKEIRDTLDDYPTIVSAVHVADQREVRFTCTGSFTYDVHPVTEASEGPYVIAESIILVYDYQRGTWMTRDAPNQYEEIKDATYCAGSYYITDASGVWKEVPDTFIDEGGSFKVSTIVLNPISPSGPISWHRVKRVQLAGRSLTPHGLSISVARDFSASTEQTKSWTSAEDVTTVGPLERAQIALAVQKTQAIEIHITDAAPLANTGTGEGFQLEGVALLVQAKQGLARTTTTRRG